MAPFRSLHDIAARRGDGLHPKLLALLSSLAVDASCDRKGLYAKHLSAFDCVSNPDQTAKPLNLIEGTTAAPSSCG